MSWNELRWLYAYIVMLEHDFAEPEKEVEYQAAYCFFEHIAKD